MTKEVYAMSIVSLESKDEKNISMSISQFFTVYGIIRFLRNCGGLKLKGVPVRELFTYTITNAFRMGSFYMQLMTPCMKGLDSSGLNMPPVCLTMCQSDI